MSTLSPDRREIMPDVIQAVQPLSELQEDVVYCNVCNVDGSKETGMFKGTLEEALQSGWTEENWGATCGTCKQDLDRMEDETVGSGAVSMAQIGSLVKHFKGV